MPNIDYAGLFLIIFIFILITLAVREIVMWYWKINDMIQNQHQQKKILLSILDEIKKMNDSNNEQNND